MNLIDSLVQISHASSLYALTWQQLVMMIVCLFLLWLGIKKQFEPLLLVPIAFGGLLSNIPVADMAAAGNFLGIIYNFGILESRDREAEDDTFKEHYHGRQALIQICLFHLSLLTIKHFLRDKKRRA